jgi:hypothetical protein
MSRSACDFDMASFEREIDVFVRDCANHPIPGARIQWKVNGVDAGTVENAEGRGRITLQDRAAIVEVTATYNGRTRTERLAPNQDHFTIVFPEINVHPDNWKEIMSQHVPALIGVFFILIVIGLAFTFNSPNPLQIHIILAVLALGGGAFAMEISGIVWVNLRFGERLAVGATGAAAIFVILYFTVPAQ